jgi:hypothetical protein
VPFHFLLGLSTSTLICGLLLEFHPLRILDKTLYVIGTISSIAHFVLFVHVLLLSFTMTRDFPPLSSYGERRSTCQIEQNSRGYLCAAARPTGISKIESPKFRSLVIGSNLAEVLPSRVRQQQYARVAMMSCLCFLPLRYPRRFLISSSNSCCASSSGIL